MVYTGSGLTILDKFINLILDHYYISILIIGLLVIVITVFIMVKKQEEKEVNKKPSIIFEFFSVLNDVFKTK